MAAINARHDVAAESTIDKLASGLEHLPSNDSLIRAIDKTKKELEKTKSVSEIDSTGKKILQDTQLVLDDMRDLIKNRNQGNRIQKIVKEGKKSAYMAREHAQRTQKAGKKTLKEVDKEQLQVLTKHSLTTIRLAITELITSPEFRTSVTDFLGFCSDVLRHSMVDRESDDEPVKKKKGKGKRKGKAKEKSTPRAPSSRESDLPSYVFKTKDSLEDAVNRPLYAIGMRKKVYLSDEQIDELSRKFLDIINTISHRNRSRQAFMGVLDLIRMIGDQLGKDKGHFKTNASKTISDIVNDKHSTKMFRLTKEAVEAFTGEDSTDAFNRHVRKLYKLIANDEETRLYFADVRKFIMKVINDPDSVNQDEVLRETKSFINRGRKLHKDQLFTHFNGVFEEGRTLAHCFIEDPILVRTRNDLRRLMNDVMFDNRGKFTINLDTWNQIRLILTHLLIEKARIPLPTIITEDKDMEYKIKGLTINLNDLIPDKIHLGDKARMQIHLKDVKHPKIRHARNTFKILATNIQFHAHNMEVWFKRKSFPHVEDHFRAKVDIGKKRGLDLAVKLGTKAGSGHLWEVKNVDCHIHKLRIRVSETNMSPFYNTFLLLVRRRIRHRIENVIEDSIESMLENINDFLVDRIILPSRRNAIVAGKKARTADYRGTARKLSKGSFVENLIEGLKVIVQGRDLDESEQEEGHHKDKKSSSESHKRKAKRKKDKVKDVVASSPSTSTNKNKNKKKGTLSEDETISEPVGTPITAV